MTSDLLEALGADLADAWSVNARRRRRIHTVRVAAAAAVAMLALAASAVAVVRAIDDGFSIGDDTISLSLPAQVACSSTECRPSGDVPSGWHVYDLNHLVGVDLPAPGLGSATEGPTRQWFLDDVVAPTGVPVSLICTAAEGSSFVCEPPAPGATYPRGAGVYLLDRSEYYTEPARGG